jgi:hypothetical protein
LKINNQKLKIENHSSHLMMVDGRVINYISHSRLLDRFIEQLIIVCNYSPGRCLDQQSGSMMTVNIDVKSDLRDYCLAHSDYITHGRLFAVHYASDYLTAILLIDPEIFSLNHQVLIDIALSMIGTIKYVMLVATGCWTPAHCALVEINGKGALICAPGGTGKSTCASRLTTPHQALAEDCALVLQTGDDFIAQAMPAWSLVTSEHKKVKDINFDCTATVKLSGIFFLEQSKFDAVEQLNAHIALGYTNSTFNDHMRWFLTHLAPVEIKKLRLNVFNLATALTAKLPAYRLSATLDGNFWDVMDKVL